MIILKILATLFMLVGLIFHLGNVSVNYSRLSWLFILVGTVIVLITIWR